MENNPLNSGPYEAPQPGAEKPDKDTKKEKKKDAANSRVEASGAASAKKERAQRELAQSIDKLPLFEREPKPSTEKPEAAPDTKAEASAEQPVEQLSEEERQHIQAETAREHLAAIDQADEQVQEQAELASDFLEKVAEGQDPEAAFAEAVAEANLTDEERALLELPDEEAEPTAEPEEAPDETVEDGAIDTTEDTEGVVNWRTPTGTAGGSGTGSRAGGAGGGGQTSGGTPPPPTPLGGTAGPAAPQPAPVAPATANLPPRVETYYQDRNKAGELLLIGLVGYLIGRRRGRIRTEKKLLPVQRKLEKQVKQLQEDITYKEKQLVAIKARRAASAETARPTVARAERTQPGRTETRLGMEKPVRAERLGHMVIAAETPRKTAEKAGTIRSTVRAEQVPDMSRNELLELSEKIVVEGATLRSIYESRLIGERQLRHLVSEYLQGKDIRKDLRQEMVEREIDFERDPMLRDRVRSRMTDNSGGAGGLGEMLAKAGITTDEHDPNLERQVEKETVRQAAARRKAQRQRVLTDTALATAVVVLAVVVAILALGR